MKKAWGVLQETIYKQADNIVKIYILFLIVSILFLLRQGDDIQFHLQRLNAIIKEFENLGLSALPIRIYHVTINGYGYGSPMFYGDIFMWPFAMLASVFNLSTLVAYKIMLIAVVIATYFTARYAFSFVFSEYKYIDVAVLLYVTSSTVFGNLTGSAVGRAYACMFVPLCICSFYSLLSNDEQKKRNIIVLAIGMTGLIYSNVLDAAIVSVVLTVLLVFSLAKINLKTVGQICIAAVLCIALTAWFVFPMIEQMGSQVFFVTSEKINQGLNDLHYWTTPFIGLFFPAKIIHTLYPYIGLDSSEIPYAYFYGIIVYVGIVIYALIYGKEIMKRKELEKNFFFGAVCILIICILFQTKLFPHDYFSGLIGVIQFPWRTGIVMACLGAIICIIVLNRSNNRSIASTLIVISLATMFVSALAAYGINIAYTIHDGREYASYDYNSMCVGAGEYFPIEMLDGKDRTAWMNIVSDRGDDVTATDSSVQYESEKLFDGIKISYSHNRSDVIFELPLIYYKGYIAVDKKDEHDYVIQKSKNGLIEVRSGKEHGEISVYYDGTIIQKVSECISCVSGIVLLVYISVLAYKRRRNMV